MSVTEGSQADGTAPGLPQLGLRLLAGALTILLLLVVGQQWGARDRAAREAFPPSSGVIRLSGLPAPVEILRDARGIPHVMAESERDGWFGLGFAHGQDRLAQMLALRRRALGRAAEIEGASALRSDRLARLLSAGAASRRVVEALPDSSRAVLEAYVAGVNARITRVRQGRVGAPSALGLAPEEITAWQPADSIAIGKLLSWCIGGTLETTLVLDDLIQRLDSVPARPFFPGRSAVDFGVAPEIPRHRGTSRTVAGPLAEAVMGTSHELCEGIGIASGGAWVLGGDRTTSGDPILVADWHTQPIAPSLFYEAHVEAEGVDVAGATIPGSPIFWVGRNPTFAWAGVPAGAPVSDLFIETLREHRGLYQNGTLWVPLESREEKIGWIGPLGRRQEETMTIRSTRHGPLIDGLHTEPGVRKDGVATAGPDRHSARALAWTGALEGDGLTSMLGLIRVEEASEVEAILETHHEPVLAFVYADAAGEGGVQVAGWMPNRPLPTGLVPVQGRLRSFDWREPVAISDLPGSRIGDHGREWERALDQPWPSRGGLDQTEWLWRSGDRATRLDQLLHERTEADAASRAPRPPSGPSGDRGAEGGKLDLRTVADLLNDARAPRAEPVVTAIVGLARLGGPLPVEAEEIAVLLERWDGRLAADSPGAAAYHIVIEHLLEHLLRDAFGKGLYERYLTTPHVRAQSAIERLVLRAATLRQAGGWTDEGRVTRAVRDSLRETWVSLNHRLGPTRERWAWGELHRIRLLRPARADARAGRSSWLRGRDTDRTIDRMPVSGSGQTLAFSRHTPGVSFEVDPAALYRVAIDLGSSDRFLSSLAPGQSEHPGHPHYLDGFGRFDRTRLALFATSRLVIEEESAQRLVLEPAP